MLDNSTVVLAKKLILMVRNIKLPNRLVQYFTIAIEVKAYIYINENIAAHIYINDNIAAHIGNILQH